ncbi:hypothetical protein [Sulfuricella sp.]|uniref:hypothetical protein n=1 Tax=Sulfuricella sp. TaxID=2099377 RepID=UPI002BE103EC|nr:hypothetical protein [Sulfuricella sp.]HUX65175.1 hypothetical protein [Sulfuricella sp.]
MSSNQASAGTIRCPCVAAAVTTSYAASRTRALSASRGSNLSGPGRGSILCWPASVTAWRFSCSMLNSSERSNSVSRPLRSAFRVRAENPNSLMTMTFSSLALGVVSAARD